ncbi:MAG: hypothetical protein PHE45_08550 [Bacteroidales bacterium]|nr:hypothetical protein [Bacteroidales bacterium]
MNNTKIYITALLLAAFFTVSAYSQTVFSPYSNFGLGNMSNVRNASLRAMGNRGYAYNDNTVVNFSNPATYSAFDTLSFLVEGSIEFQSLTLSTSNYSETGYNTGFNQLQFGFPIWKYIKASIGLLPYSNVGYSVENEIIDDIVGKQTYKFEGEGGVNDFYGGLSFQYKNFAIGANVSYLFGSIDKTQALYYSDSSNFFNVKRIEQLALSSISLDFGALYNAKLSKDLFLSIGAVYRPQMNLNSNNSYVAYTFTESSGTETLQDTIANDTYIKGSVIYPQKIGGGIMLKKLNRYKLLVNFDWTEWSKYESVMTKQGDLTDAYNASIGFEYSPRSATLSSYWKWVKYRMGAYYGKQAILLNDTEIDQFGITFGLGLPIVRSFSAVNLSLDLGIRGTVVNNLIQETYFTVTFGFSFYDTWFYRVKYK